ncbi:MAG: D-alanyl-D-alanine carboxypeptidase family protein [Actinobacteria bacterium]|nr:D-alanyl-D-alanine carboxypeptidase family protein [Actinomycetota bacterium]
MRNLPHPRRLVAPLIAGALIATLGGSAGGRPGRANGGCPAAPRESIDVLQASASGVRATLAAVETQRAAAQAAVADAQQAAVTARSAVSAAEVAVAAATVREEGLREDVRASVVRAFVGGTGEDDLGIVGATNLDDVVEATRRSTFFTNDADQRRRLIEEHRASERALRRELASQRRAVVTAERSEATAAAEVARLEQVHHDQVLMAAQVEARLEAALAEAAAIKAIDPSASKGLASEEAALQAEVQAALGNAAGADGSSGGSAAAPSGGGAETPTTTTPKSSGTRSTTSTTAAPSGGGGGGSATTTPDIVTVRGIRVARSVAPLVDEMLGAASAAGLKLSGGGYRDPASQIALRKAHCGSSEYDIWQKPSSQCSPPTARPGRSMHEQGLALDLTCSGSLISSRNSPCFVWLAANAATYGFYNLPSEPWHWSINGK